MRRVWADAKAFGVQFMRSKVGAFFAFAFPVILILLFGAIFSGGGDTKIPVYVQDLDDISASRAFVEALNGTTIVSYRQIPKGVDIRAHIEENSINIALRIPQGFQAAVASAMAGNTTARVNVTVYGDPTQSSYGIALSAVSGAATAMNFGIAASRPSSGRARSRSPARASSSSTSSSRA